MKALKPITPTREQLKAIVNTSKVLLIRGALGSGKTTTAILRLKTAIGKAARDFNRRGITGRIRILVLTYNRTLESYVKALINHEIRAAHLAGGPQLDVEMSTLTRWAKDLAIAGGNNLISNEERADWVRRTSHGWSVNDDFLTQELDYVTGIFSFQNVEDYMGWERVGRGLNPKFEAKLKRRFIDEIVRPYFNWKQANQRVDFNDLIIEAQTIPSVGYDIVLCDEVQDFPRTAVQAIRHHGKADGDLILVFDGAQRIYPRGFTWISAGIEIRPENVCTLHQNFRCPREVADFIEPLYQALDIGGDDGTKPKSDECQPCGLKPYVLKGKYGKQLEWVFDIYIPKCVAENETVAFLKAKGGGYFKTLEEELVRRGLNHLVISRNSTWADGDEQFLLSTMHSAKGLEFDHVIMLGVNSTNLPYDSTRDDHGDHNLKRLFIMACGRTRKGLVIGFKPGEESEIVQTFASGTFKEVSL
jgi:superfamily I DNA/RNA helicase